MTKIRIAALQLEAHNIYQARISLERALEMIDRAAQEYQPDLIVLPECTYPGYVIGSPREFSESYPGDPVPYFSAKAKENNCHIVVGLATPEPQEIANLQKPGKQPVVPTAIYNEAILIGPDGTIIGRTAKSVMWHFDSRWFVPGQEYPVFETAIGRIGLMVCADGREPEIARELALAGAQLIVVPTAWVTYGADPATLNNPQADFMLATRAWENGVVCVAADKVGLERNSVLYSGRSQIIDARGFKVAVGTSNVEEIVFGQVELPDHPQTPALKRPELYSSLTNSTEILPIHEILQIPLIPSKATLRCAVAQYSPFNTTEGMGETVRRIVRQLNTESANLVVFPDVPFHMSDEAAFRGELVWPFYRSLSKLSGVALLATAFETEGTNRFKTACLFANGIEVGRWRQTHLGSASEMGCALGDQIGPVVQLPGLHEARLGVMLGTDGFAPEVARCLMLMGADIILWPTQSTLTENFDFVKLVRSRAAENRIYVLVSTLLTTSTSLENSDPTGCSMIADPNGNVVAAALTHKEMTVSSQISIPLARQKLSAPDTDVVYSRRPFSYKLIAKVNSNS